MDEAGVRAGIDGIFLAASIVATCDVFFDGQRALSISPTQGLAQRDGSLLIRWPPATAPQVNALRSGLEAVDRMKADGTLPPAAKLTDEALDNSDLNVFIKAAIRALPDSLINSALKTDDVLKRTINGLDLRTLLTNLNDSDELTTQINGAVTKAVKAALLARLRGLL